MIKNMESYINYEMCKKCGGACCKQNGCIYLPKDFENLSFDYLKKEIDKGYISISGQPFVLFKDAWSFLLYLRARNVNSNIVDLFPVGGPCALLTDTGCSLDETKRPSLGLMVESTKIGGPCKKKYDSDIALNWLDYDDVLSKLIKYYTNMGIQDIICEQINNKISTIKTKIEAKEVLTSMEQFVVNEYKIMVNKSYYSPDEVKKFILLY